MTLRNIKLLIVGLLFISCTKSENKEFEAMQPPIAEKIAYKYSVHNKEIIDDYHWLRDNNWPKVSDKKVLEYLKAENEYSEQFFKENTDLKEQIFKELKGRIKLTDQTPYVKKENYYYYSRTEEDKDYSIYCRKYENLDAPEEIILDVNELAKNKKYITLGAYAISPKQDLLAFSVDDSGNESFTIYIKDLKTGKLLEDQIPTTIGNIVWYEDQSGFFYTPTDENWRHYKVFFHKLGQNPSEDKLIMHESDVLNQLSVNKSSSKDYIFITSAGHDSSEIFSIKMNDPELNPKLLITRKEKTFYNIDHNGEYFYIHTNDKGPNFRLARTRINYTAQDGWEDYLPYEADKYLEGFDITKTYLIANYKEKALPLMEVYNLDTKSKKTINFPDEVYTASGYSTNFEEDDIRINYSSLKRPNTVYNYYYDNEKLILLKQTEIPSGFDPEEYEVRRLWADNEGVKIPISVFYKKSLFKNDGSNPLYLYGYGSYGHAISPQFRNTAITLADKGFIFAIAHIRGGDDLGFEWYESAKFLTKKRTFEDFIRSAEYLISTNYTSSGNIVICGGSAGGLLMGYALNNAPHLFKAAIAHVPFVDVVNTMLDESLPLTPGEFKEWGNPKEEEYFDYMLSYSPYDNVKKQNYPALYITAGLTDPRVTYWEAAKWVAKLRANKSDNNIILLKTNMEAGHFGVTGRDDYLKEVAEDYVFIFRMFGINFNK